MRGVNAEPPGMPPGPGSVRQRLAAPGGLLLAAVAAFGYVGTVDPNEPGHYPACPLLRYTGVYCPGCGGLRSAYAVVHGDLGTALGANALAVLGCLVCAVMWTVWMVRSLRGRPMRVDPGPSLTRALGMLLLLFTVVRNLPFGGWLRP